MPAEELHLLGESVEGILVAELSGGRGGGLEGEREGERERGKREGGRREASFLEPYTFIRV